MTFPVTEHTVKTARHTTGYLACGAEGAPLLIFVHGWPELSLSWRHQLLKSRLRWTRWLR